MLGGFVPLRPGQIRPWLIHLGRVGDELKDRPLYLRVKFNTAQTVARPDETYLAVWQFGVPKKTALYQSPVMSLSADTFHEFEVPPNLFDANGDLTILFRNLNDTALLFPLEEAAVSIGEEEE